MTIWNPAGVARLGRRRAAQGALWLVLPLLGLAYQVAAKEVAADMGDLAFGPAWLARAANLPWAWAMAGFDVISFAAWMVVLSQMKLSAAFSLSAAGYVLIVAVGWTVFHEPAGLLQIVGGVLILAGLGLIGRKSADGA